MSSSSICLEEKGPGAGLRWLVAAAVAAMLVPAAHALNPSRLIQQYLRDRWADDQGYTGGAVNALAQTPDGYLWIGAEKGLVRFDGSSFEIFNHANIAALPDGPVLDLATDAGGSLWIRMQSRQLVRYRRGRFEAVPQPAEVTAMAPGLRRDVLLVRPGDAMRMNDNRLVHLYPAAGNRLVISIAETRDGTVWSGTRDYGLFAVRDGRVFAPATLPDRKVNCLLAGDGETLWVGTDRGLARWNGSRLTQNNLPEVLKTAQVLAMARDHDSNVWLGTSRGLLRITEGGGFLADPQLGASHEPVSSLFEDREGNLWIGRPQAIERLRDTAFLTYSSAVAGSPEGGGPVYVDQAGRTWQGGNSGGLFCLKGGQWRQVDAAGLSRDVVYSIDGAAGEIWMGRQRGGLTHLRFADDSFAAETFTAADGLAPGSVYSVHRSRDGTVWAGSWNAGVSRVRAGRVTTYTTAAGLASNTVSAIEEGSDGTVWFATADGLSVFAADRWRSSYQP